MKGALLVLVAASSVDALHLVGHDVNFPQKPFNNLKRMATRRRAPLAAENARHPRELLRLQGGAGRGKRAAMTFYSCVGGGFAVLLLRTLRDHPMFPFQPTSAAWSYSWLVTTVFDYYGAALCLCGIALSSEERVPGLLWSAGFCLLGTPVCAAYMITRLATRGSVRLAD
jgi:hypothetical protein